MSDTKAVREQLTAHRYDPTYAWAEEKILTLCDELDALRKPLEARPKRLTQWLAGLPTPATPRLNLARDYIFALEAEVNRLRSMIPSQDPTPYFKNF
jgi:hypothetical protein